MTGLEDASPKPAYDRDATDGKEVDDRFRALLEGLRATLPGVQVLVAFLLVLPVQTGFSELGSVERIVYYAAFASAVVSSVLFLAPSAHQRLRSPATGIPRRHPHHVEVAVKLTIGATAALAVALTASVYLVTTLVFDDALAIVAAAVVFVLMAWSWAYFPLIDFNE